MIRRSARNDPTAGSISGKRLSDIIEQTRKNEERDNFMEESRRKGSRSPQEAFKHPWEGVDSQEAYKRGYEAGIERSLDRSWDADMHIIEEKA